MRRSSPTRLPAPCLRRIWLDRAAVPDAEAYPWCLPFLRDAFGSPSTGRSRSSSARTARENRRCFEGIAALAGFDEAGGGKGYRPVDHSGAVEAMGGRLASALRASWLPKVTDGWFFRAESFFSVARYLDSAARESGYAPPDFLSHSHGEGFLRFFEERCQRPFIFQRRGIFIVDQPESALSPARQIEFLEPAWTASASAR